MNRLGFSQLIHEPTHIKGRIIDQAYLLDPTKSFNVSVERYSPYYTDHDAICISLEDQLKGVKKNTVTGDQWIGAKKSKE